MPVSFNHTLQFSLDVISHRDSLKGYPRSLFLVRNSWSHTAGSQPQPCTCCQDHGHPPSWHSSSCSFIGSCCCCSTHTSSSHISVFCNSLPGQNLPALFGKCVSNNHLQCKFCWCWGFFLPPFPFPFRDKLIFQLGWDTQITLFLFAKSQGSHSAQGLCKCSHACMWGQPGTCLVLTSLSFPKKPFLAGALPATPDVARQHKHSSQTPVRKGLSSIRY